MLNETYNLNLQNANNIKRNFPGVDLVDNENRVAFQITATSSLTKIKHTIEEFVKHKLYENFDFIFIYILTTKQKTYNKHEINKIVDNKFDFQVNEHIIDSNDIYKKLYSALKPSKIEAVDALLAEEFTDKKIDTRKELAEKKEELTTEDIYLNLLKINLPETVYIGDLNIERDEIIKSSWETEWKLKKRASERKVILRALKFLNDDIPSDWHVIENKLITFKNLKSDDTILNKIVDLGTVDPISTADFPYLSESYYFAFVQLLKNTIKEKLFLKNIQWVKKSKIYRFKPSQKLVGIREINWKLKKKATRKVIDEVWNKEGTQILCFKHLAFKSNVHNLNNEWYLSINPTWSYTWNGYKKSFLEPTMLKGIKQLENNKSIYYAFRFISYCLMNKIEDEISNYDLLSFSIPKPMKLTYNK